MKCYVVIRETMDGTEIMYCGTNEEVATKKLYQGKRANVSMDVWESDEYVTTKWGDHEPKTQ